VDGGLTAVQATEVREFASQGATVLLLPGLGPEQANWFDLTTEKRKLFGGRVRAHELLRGIGDGDVYLKAWAELDCVRPDAGWSILVEPGLLALRPEGRGRLIACRLPIDALGQTRGRIKALRFWNLLLANLRLRRDGDATFLTPAASPYAENEWEQMPPYINW
jgi:hypothetical protein